MIDIESLQDCIITVIAIIVSTVAILKKNGYWDKIVSKLRIPSAIASTVGQQDNEIVIAKLAIPDDVMDMLNAFAMDENGKIVLEKASLVLQDQGRFNTLRNITRPLTEPEKDEFIQIVKRVMCAYRY